MKSISSKKLKGNILIPGDKSISHRLVILSSIAIGRSNIKGLLKSDDIMKTIGAMQNFLLISLFIFFSFNENITNSNSF